MAEYIDRTSIYDVLMMENPFGWNNDDLAESFRQAKAADVAPVRHGKWVDALVRDWRCSECGKQVPKQVHFDGYCYDDKLPYCPNCGAKMDEKEGEQE